MRWSELWLRRWARDYKLAERVLFDDSVIAIGEQPLAHRVSIFVRAERADLDVDQLILRFAARSDGVSLALERAYEQPSVLLVRNGGYLNDKGSSSSCCCRGAWRWCRMADGNWFRCGNQLGCGSRFGRSSRCGSVRRRFRYGSRILWLIRLLCFRNWSASRRIGS